MNRYYFVLHGLLECDKLTDSVFCVLTTIVSILHHRLLVEVHGEQRKQNAVRRRGTFHPVSLPFHCHANVRLNTAGHQEEKVRGIDPIHMDLLSPTGACWVITAPIYRLCACICAITSVSVLLTSLHIGLV